MGRDAAGAAVGVSRSLAAFHLDKLAAAGLLDVEFRRPAGRRGPGAGRPAKLYRRAERQLDVTLPPRRYELAARILAAAVHRMRPAGDRSTESLRSTPRVAPGRRWQPASWPGWPAVTLREARSTCCRHSATNRSPTATMLVLRNCPFHALAVEHTDLVCGVNADLLASFCDALPDLGLDAELAPAPGRCCVTLTKSVRRG